METDLFIGNDEDYLMVLDKIEAHKIKSNYEKMKRKVRLWKRK